MENHKHRCPRHGSYVCPWVTNRCSVLTGREKQTYHCPKCITKQMGLRPGDVKKLQRLKANQIRNKRAYRERLASRPTNRVARGVR